MTLLLDWIIPIGPWRRGSGYPFLLDLIRWLWFPGRARRRGEHEIDAYEIDSMAYIFDSMDAWRP